jgi:hypothetical protein
LRNYGKFFEQRLSYTLIPLLGSYVDVFNLRNITPEFTSILVLSEEQRTYSPGLPVHVEKLKKYSTKPMASPGASKDPENARSAFAMRDSKICFLICGGRPLWKAADHPLISPDVRSPVRESPLLDVVLFRRQPAQPNT